LIHNLILSVFCLNLVMIAVANTPHAVGYG
jgi:hypothetical protein